MTTPPPQHPERALSLVYAPQAARSALAALWLLDERLAGIVTEPNRAISAIKLAWWREALERLDHAPPPPEPLLQALSEALATHGVTGAALAAIATGWDALIDDVDENGTARLARHARLRGPALFDVAAAMLGGAGGKDLAEAGAIWAAASVPPSVSDQAARCAFFASVAPIAGRWPRRLRALGVLATLGRETLRQPAIAPGAPSRVARALWLGISGY